MKIKLLLAIGTSAVLLIGCSSASPEPKYDELELLVFKLCMEDYLVADRTPLNRFERDYSSESFEDTRSAYQVCKELMPEKQ